MVRGVVRGGKEVDGNKRAGGCCIHVFTGPGIVCYIK